MIHAWHWPIWASSPERAILEALDELPRQATFENLDLVFEGLVSLRPHRLTALLRACRSVKVRRLFFVFADRHAHGWRDHLDPSAIDFGSGPRALVEGGRFHPDYRISIPETLMLANSKTQTTMLDRYLPRSLRRRTFWAVFFGSHRKVAPY